MVFRPRLNDPDPLPTHVEELGSLTMDAAYEVHSELGPGLLERVYRDALGVALEMKGIPCAIEVPAHAYFRDIPLGTGFRADVIVNGTVVVEVKTVESISPAHEAQLLTYMRFLKKPLGYVFNFNEAHLRSGMRRKVNRQALTQ